MARLTVGQKAERVLRLLIALRNPRVAMALQAHGFDDADLAEGWSNLQAVCGGRLGAPIVQRLDPEALRSLDAWENRWFPIVRATLEHRFPKLAEKVFANLAQTEGLAVVVSVSTLIERIDALAAEGDEGRRASELLAKRGLTAAELADVRAQLERMRTIPDTAPAAFDEARAAELGAAEKRLWDWYLEWSQIARQSVHSRQLLRELGFLQGVGGNDDHEEPVETAPAAADTAR
jgi:hypothetical protein